MKVSLVNASGTLFEGFASEIVLPVQGGEMSVLDYHEPFFAALGQGRIRVKFTSRSFERRRPLFLGRRRTEGNVAETFSVTGGVVRMKNNEVVILVES